MEDGHDTVHRLLSSLDPQAEKNAAKEAVAMAKTAKKAANKAAGRFDAGDKGQWEGGKPPPPPRQGQQEPATELAVWSCSTDCSAPTTF